MSYGSTRLARTGRWAAVATSLVLTLGVTPALAAAPVTPTPGPSQAAAGDVPIGPATPGTEVCTVTNTNIDEVTGIVATEAGIYAVQGGDTFEPNGVVIWTINATTCAATNRNYGFSPVDPQDLAVGSDGALWVGDIGDGQGSNNERTRLTFEKVTPGAGQAVPHRALYPTAGRFHSAAMLLQRGDVPLLFVNESGKVGLFAPDAPPPANTQNGLPTMTRVGEFIPVKTGTANPLGNIGSALVTGAAKSPDGKRVVVRTKSDAYEWTVGADGDILGAITKTKPRITRLPGEEDGQAITYSADGALFLTMSSGEKPKLRSYTPYVPPVVAAADTPGEEKAPEPGFLSGLKFSDITLIATIFGLLGLAAVIAGIVGIVLYRRRYRQQFGDVGAARPARAKGKKPARRPTPDRDGRDRSRWEPEGGEWESDGPVGDDQGWDEEWNQNPEPGWDQGPGGREPERPRRPDGRGHARSGRATVPAWGGDGPGAPGGEGPRADGHRADGHRGGRGHGPGGHAVPGPMPGGPMPGGYVPGGAPGTAPGTGARGGRGPETAGRSGGGNVYRGAASVQPPPPDYPPGPPESRRGQVYGGGGRYPDDDDVT